MRIQSIFAAIAFLLAAGGATAQDQPLKLKGGHFLGEPASQFFNEGVEKGAFGACKTGDYKSLALPNKRGLKSYCRKLADARDEALSGTRSEYKGGGDTSDLREDTFTFDQARLVKAELVYSAPSAEVNYRGESFDKILEGAKEAYGPPTSETSEATVSTSGVPYVAHRELWLGDGFAILVTQSRGSNESTTVAAFTRAEYDRATASETKAANPLQ